jgi:PKD repeat protein
MNKGLLSILIGAGMLVFLTSNILYHTGSPGGKTGSPGDGNATCTQCHTGTPVTVTGWITSNIPASGYVPGQTYTITATATHTGAVLFGFEMTAENASNNKTGTFIITNATQTQLVNNNKSVTHTQNGTTPSGNSKSWSVNWTAPAAGTGNVTFYGAFNAANGNGGSSGDVIYKTSTLVPEGNILEADFSANPTTVCPGGQVQFTDLSAGNPTQWQWTFTGGTPSSSTQQNPLVTYNTPGSYSVTLLVSNGSSSDQIIKSNYIQVLPAAPPVPASPTGNAQLCENPPNTQYTTTGSSGASGYTWQLDPTEAGLIIGSGTTISVNWNDTFTGVTTLKVRATNTCGQSAFSSPLTITLNPLPVTYTVSGGGSYCFGTSGATIQLSGSQEGHSYELWLDGQATGNILQGTGTAINFTSITPAGNYTILATSNSAPCSNLMNGSAQVTVIFPPEAPSSPQGPNYVDLFSTSQTEYTTEGAPEADSYEWILEPAAAGVINSINAFTILITWNNEFLGVTTLAVRGVNECGAGDWSQSLSITVTNTVGLAEEGMRISLLVSPNPNNGTFRLNVQGESSEHVSLAILNLLGEKIWEEKYLTINGGLTRMMELGKVPRGIYLVRIESRSSSTVHKFIIQ